MSSLFQRHLNTTFRLAESEGRDKLVGLKQAIQKFVQPGMSLYLGEAAGAAVCEIMRTYRGKSPGFTVACVLTIHHRLNLAASGLVKKLITTNCTEMFPAPGPSKQVQRAVKERRLTIENWSLCSISQRLFAGACDLPFMPTKSIYKSSMANENDESFKHIQDPFDNKQSVGLVRAFKPDLTVIHGLAADRYGNTILPSVPFSGESSWAAKAAKYGAIVTAENIVSTDFIRRHSHMVDLPGFMVLSVSEVPFGAHPQGIFGWNLDEFQPYADDYDFMNDMRRASQTEETLNQWLEDWVFNCRDHSDYLSKLDNNRLNDLRKKAEKNYLKSKLNSIEDLVDKHIKVTDAEKMVVTSARKIEESALKNGFRIILSGIGTSALAAWLANYKLKERGYDSDLLMGSGLYGFAPPPGDPMLGSIPSLYTCKIMSDVIDAYAVTIGGHPEKCISVLGGAQVDRWGNINSTKISEGLYLIGSGGANDAANASEALVLTSQSSSRLVDRLPYITVKGDNVKTLVTQLGVFEKLNGDSEFILTGYISDNENKITEEEMVRTIKQNCGWELKVAASLRRIELPTADELMILRMIDPEGFFTS